MTKNQLTSGCNMCANISFGFTLIELLVVVGIFGILSSVIFANYSGFDSIIVLENVAHEIALEVRQAQSFGIGVREFSSGNDEFPIYGVRVPSLSSGMIQNIFLFADIPPVGQQKGNGVYDGGDSCVPGSGECVEQVFLQKYYIYAICGNIKKQLGDYTPFRMIDDVTASGAAVYCDKDALEITFTRPNPDAFSTGYEGGVKDPESPYSDAEIIVATPGGHVRTVVVWSTGQITVE
jgi:prepilin-type N-terminal cleavage/methylation domain-containing protein